MKAKIKGINLSKTSENRITIDLEGGQVTIEGDEGSATYAIGAPEAFRAISRAWLRSGWDSKSVYSFTWLGRPIIQLPEDMIRLQEVVFSVQPDVIIETGIAHGGSLVFYASLCKLIEKGRVIGIDIEIRPHNLEAIQSHPLSSFITMIEGNSIEPATVDEVKSHIRSDEKVMVLLDSCHQKQHVLSELRAYSQFVSSGSYIVAMDGIMENLPGAPRSEPDWSWNNPRQAALEFVAQNADFVIEEPQFAFNEGNITERVTYWPSAFVKRVSS